MTNLTDKLDYQGNQVFLDGKKLAEVGKENNKKTEINLVVARKNLYTFYLGTGSWNSGYLQIERNIELGKKRPRPRFYTWGRFDFGFNVLDILPVDGLEERRFLGDLGCLCILSKAKKNDPDLSRFTLPLDDVLLVAGSGPAKAGVRLLLTQDSYGSRTSRVHEIISTEEYREITEGLEQKEQKLIPRLVPDYRKNKIWLKFYGLKNNQGKPVLTKKALASRDLGPELKSLEEKMDGALRFHPRATVSLNHHYQKIIKEQSWRNLAGFEQAQPEKIVILTCNQIGRGNYKDGISKVRNREIYLIQGGPEILTDGSESAGERKRKQQLQKAYQVRGRALALDCWKDLDHLYVYIGRAPEWEAETSAADIMLAAAQELAPEKVTYVMCGCTQEKHRRKLSWAGRLSPNIYSCECGGAGSLEEIFIQLKEGAELERC